MNKKILTSLALAAVGAFALTSCGKASTGTASAVEKASKMSLKELEDASKKEFEDNPNGVFKVVGLTSVLQKVATTVSEKYDWINFNADKPEEGNVSVNNSYKDYTLLTALSQSEGKYFADFALCQDARSFSSYLEDGLLHNYVPKDIDSLGVPETGKNPLYGVLFNKLFWTNKNFETINGFKLHNIWQLTGMKGKKTDKTDYCPKISFQSPATEQINMSFLVSCEAPENQARIKEAYKAYYGVEWSSTEYGSAGEQWVTEFVKSITRWHSSDGTAMKETQLKDDWKEGYVYYGAFAKMKDAVGKFYEVEGQASDPILKNLVQSSGDNAGKICAMDTVQWDWDIKGFNGFMYCMDSEICDNAEFPYTACLFARTLLEESTYANAIYNKSTPGADGQKANQYGYYYPGAASADFKYAKGDWTKEVHFQKEIVENYDYLKGVTFAQTASILALM